MDKYPEIFRGASEYKDDPEAFRIAQETWVENGAYLAISKYAKQWSLKQKREPLLLDLCCATGLACWHVAKKTEVEKIILVDNDAYAINLALKTNKNFDNIVPIVGDAVTFKYNQKIDIIIMNSAYHHIPNDKKIDFLRNASKLLSNDGIILIGEHFLPDYSNTASYRSSVISYYSALIEEMKRRKDDTRAINVIRRAALYCWQGYYEYKVSWKVFEKHVSEAGLLINDTTDIWFQNSSMDTNIGCYVVKVGCQ